MSISTFPTYTYDPETSDQAKANLKHIHESLHALFNRATNMRDLIPCGRAKLGPTDLDQPRGETTLRDLLKGSEKMAGFLLEVVKQAREGLGA